MPIKVIQPYWPLTFPSQLFLARGYLLTQLDRVSPLTKLKNRTAMVANWSTTKMPPNWVIDQSLTSHRLVADRSVTGHHCWKWLVTSTSPFRSHRRFNAATATSVPPKWLPGSCWPVQSLTSSWLLMITCDHFMTTQSFSGHSGFASDPYSVTLCTLCYFKFHFLVWCLFVVVLCPSNI